MGDGRDRARDRDPFADTVGHQVDADRLVLSDRSECYPKAKDPHLALDTPARAGTRSQLGDIEDQPRHNDHNLPTMISRGLSVAPERAGYFLRTRIRWVSPVSTRSGSGDSRRPRNDSRPRATAAAVFWSTISKLASLAST